MKTALESWTEAPAAGSEQLPELLGVHADDRQDVPQCALSNIAARMDRYDNPSGHRNDASRDGSR